MSEIILIIAFILVFAFGYSVARTHYEKKLKCEIFCARMGMLNEIMAREILNKAKYEIYLNKDVIK